MICFSVMLEVHFICNFLSAQYNCFLCLFSYSLVLSPILEYSLLLFMINLNANKLSEKYLKPTLRMRSSLATERLVSVVPVVMVAAGAVALAVAAAAASGQMTRACAPTAESRVAAVSGGGRPPLCVLSGRRLVLVVPAAAGARGGLVRRLPVPTVPLPGSGGRLRCLRFIALPSISGSAQIRNERSVLTSGVVRARPKPQHDTIHPTSSLSHHTLENKAHIRDSADTINSNRATFCAYLMFHTTNHKRKIILSHLQGRFLLTCL